MFTIAEIIKAIRGELVPGAGYNDIHVPVNGVSIDSRDVKAWNVFFAVKGDRFDGHDFLKSVSGKNPAVVVAQRSKIRDIKSLVGARIPIIAVKDTRFALGELARFYRGKFLIPVIAVTGSCGKTTTKDMTAHVLSSQYKVLKNQSSFNNDIGVPLTLFGLSDEQICMIEIGTNNFGEVKRLSEIADPTIGIITNIGNSHLKGLINRKGVFKEKSALFDNERTRVCVFNGDDKYLMSLKQTKKIKTRKLLDFGLNPNNYIRGDKIQFHDKGVSFRINKKYSVKLRTMGLHNVYNALAAFTAGYVCGMDIPRIIRRLGSFESSNMRSQKIHKKTVTFINDAYNANPDSAKAAIDMLGRYYKDRKKIAVIGDMLELGKSSKKLHCEIGEHIADSDIKILICVGHQSRFIAERACSRGMKTQAVFYCKNNKDALKLLRKKSDKDCVVLLKGSRAMKLEEIINAF